MSVSPAILITYHNEGNLLRRCLESLAMQTRPVGEVVIYDDASTVRPEAHVPDRLAVRLVRGERNIGPARGRNVLLAQASSPFVHFHDADDAFEMDWNERVSTTLARTDADAVFTEVSSVTDEGAVRESILGLDAVAAGEDLTRFCLRGSMLVPAGTYRRAAIEAIGGYRDALWQSEDWDFHVRLAASGVTSAVVLEPLVRIYLRAASRSRDTTAVWTSAVDAVRLLSKELRSEYRPDLAEAAARAGSHLFRSGAHGDARAAFALARSLGPPRHDGETGVYRTVARYAGQEIAERTGEWYRRLVPQSLRALRTQPR